jgi:hypothetical protein
MRNFFGGIILTIIVISNIHSVGAKTKLAPMIASNTEEVVSSEVHENSEEANPEVDQEINSMIKYNIDMHESELNHNEMEEEIEIDESFDESDESWIEDTEEDQEDF